MKREIPDFGNTVMGTWLA